MFNESMGIKLTAIDCCERKPVMAKEQMLTDLLHEILTAAKDINCSVTNLGMTLYGPVNEKSEEKTMEPNCVENHLKLILNELDQARTNLYCINGRL